MMKPNAERKPALPAFNFSGLLLNWDNQSNTREMPWKKEKDPYRIWLSEIILQQTRVEQGLPYFLKFVTRFPDVFSLAKATEQEVFKCWEGLGYYSRCRNLHNSAKKIVSDFRGEFPGTYNDLISLKGIGPYTAAAICSFAYNLPYAVLDGNVFRVLSRVTGTNTAIDSTAGKKFFSVLAQEFLDKDNPAKYNQAIMDFGATVCKPEQPLCDLCPFNKYCIAFQSNAIDSLPVKLKKAKIRERWFNYFVLKHKGETAIYRREGRDIWQGLYEFPMIETDKKLSADKLLLIAMQKGWLGKTSRGGFTLSSLYQQQLTHQRIKGQFLIIELKGKQLVEPGWMWTKNERLSEFSFPRIVRDFIAA